MAGRWRRLAGGAALAAAACSLQGCSPAAAEGAARGHCPAVQLQGAGGRVEEAEAQQEIVVSCPPGLVYAGPRLQCSWVDRVCMADGPTEVQPSACTNRYNLTLRGHGLTEWPAGLAPMLLNPLLVAVRRADVLRRLARVRQADSRLPRTFDAESLKCVEPPYVDLDFQKATISHNNLFGQGPNEGPETLVFEGIASVHGEEVDMEISSTFVGPASGSPERNGLGGASGRLNINTTLPATLTFQFKRHKTGLPLVLPRVPLTLLGISQGDGEDVEVIASGLAEYFVSKHSLVEVHPMGAASYAFGGIARGVKEEDTLAKDPAKSSVTELWLDSLNRSAMLVFRNTSQFVLSVRALAGSQDFEFAGWSEVGREEVGRRVQCAQKQFRQLKH